MITQEEVVGLVVDWNTPQDLIKLIESSWDWESEGFNWSVYRNFHPDHREPYMLRAKNPRASVALVDSNENKGHGYGINRAAVEASRLWNARYYFIVNPDCLFTNPIIDELIDFLEEDPDRWVVGPKQLDSKMRITAAGIFGTDLKPKHRHWMTPDSKNVLARDSQQAIMAAGSAFLIRAKAFHDLGGMLEARHYYSDTWLSYHARAHGGQVWYHGKAWLIHEWHRSSPVGFDGTDGNFKNDRELFRKRCREHDPPILCE